MGGEAENSGTPEAYNDNSAQIILSTRSFVKENGSQDHFYVGRNELSSSISKTSSYRSGLLFCFKNIFNNDATRVQFEEWDFFSDFPDISSPDLCNS